MSQTIFTAEQLEEAESNGSCAWPTQRGDLVLRKEDLVVTNSLMNMAGVVQVRFPSISLLSFASSVLSFSLSILCICFYFLPTFL
jgi:hypothetical protein